MSGFGAAGQVPDATLAIGRLVLTEQGVALDAAFGRLRRIQFDIERERPATRVIVPDDRGDDAQVLSIPTPEVPRVTEAVAIISDYFARLD
jgi:hypothetical protein